MPKVHYVKSAQKDNSVVKKGEPYFWWKIKTGPASGVKRMSATRPRQSQLTQSAYWSAVYAIQESFEDRTIDRDEDFQSIIDDIVAEVQEVLDETQEKFDNMPEGLQQGDTGQTLEERIGNLESVISELESISIPDPEEFEADEDSDESEDDQRDSWLDEQIENFRSEIESSFGSF